MMRDDELHVVLSIEDNYAEFAAAMVTSLFVKNKEFEKIIVHLISNGVTHMSLQNIASCIDDRGEFHVYDIEVLSEKIVGKIKNAPSLSMYAWLFVSSLLSDDIERVLYLDVDTLFLGSIYRIWGEDLGENLVAGVIDDIPKYARRAIGLDNDEPYINTGFNILQLCLWRKENLEKKILEYIDIKQGGIIYHDQGLLNFVCENRKKILPIEYNMMTNYYIFPYYYFKNIPCFYSKVDFENGKRDALFIHFTAGVAGRPWLTDCRHPMKAKYQEIKSMTPYRNVPLHFSAFNWHVRLMSFIFWSVSPLLYFVCMKMRDIMKSVVTIWS